MTSDMLRITGPLTVRNHVETDAQGERNGQSQSGQSADEGDVQRDLRDNSVE